MAPLLYGIVSSLIQTLFSEDLRDSEASERQSSASFGGVLFLFFRGVEAQDTRGPRQKTRLATRPNEHTLCRIGTAIFRSNAHAVGQTHLSRRVCLFSAHPCLCTRR